MENGGKRGNQLGGGGQGKGFVLGGGGGEGLKRIGLAVILI